MKQATHLIELPARGQGLHDISAPLRGWAEGQRIGEGLLTIFCRHTSCSLLIQENAAPAARADLERFFARIAPEDPRLYTHNEEGPDDMPAHIRAALTQVQLSIPLAAGRLVLGTWQGIYLFEHRSAPHRRTLALHLLGE